MTTFTFSNAAANPPTTVATRTLIQRVADTTITYGGVTRDIYAVNGLIIVGADAYMIKTDTSGDQATGWTSLYHIDNFNTASAVTAAHTITMQGSTAPVDMGHANGIAYYKTPSTDPLEVGSFYIPMLKALGDYQVAQVNNQGEITALFMAHRTANGVTANKKIASITYYGNSTFIVGTTETSADPDDDNIIRKTYYLATISGNYFELGTKFYVPTTKTFNTGQDIYYDAGHDQLLVPVWDGKNELGTATGLRNRIIVVDLGTITNGRVYTPSRWISVNVDATDASKFEIEGISRDANGKLFVASNIIHPDGFTFIDGIHKLT
jgi:hypothetical protein